MRRPICRAACIGSMASVSLEVITAVAKPQPLHEYLGHLFQSTRVQLEIEVLYETSCMDKEGKTIQDTGSSQYTPSLL